MIAAMDAPLRDGLEEELRRLRATDVGQRISALQVLLGEANGTTPELMGALEASLAAAKDGPRRSGRGVSEAKLRAVREYMQAHGEARQVDVSNDLDENSGSVSLALRALADAGDVEDTGRVIDKSKLWRWTGEPGPRRVTNVEPGVGISEGRKR